MPVQTGNKTYSDALGEVCNGFNDLQASVGADPHDLEFLQHVLGSQIVNNVVHAQEVLEMDYPPGPESTDAVGITKDVYDDLERAQGSSLVADELMSILSGAYLRSLIEVHDDIANQNFDEDSAEPNSSLMPDDHVFEYDPPDPVFAPTRQHVDDRVVSVRKVPGEPLGITVTEQDDNLVVERIFAGSSVERQGLLHVGDIIIEVNDDPVYTPEDIVDIIREVQGSISFKIIPGHKDSAPVQPMYMKAHFTYNPDKDNYIPCREAGLPFNAGEILEVLNRDDEKWWQARHIGGENNPTGLIPSQQLEQSRQSFVKPDYDMTSSKFCGLSIKKKKKEIFDAKKNSDYQKNDVLVYEEVAKLPPFERKTLVLVGPPGVGRRSLKNKFIEHDSQRFGTAVPHTSRTLRPDETDGVGYWHESPEKIQQDIKNGEYLEYGEFEGEFYGTRIDSITAVIRSGKMCIIDCNAEGAKLLKQLPELMPLVVFISSPPIEVLKSMYEESRQIGRDIQVRTERDMRRTVQESARIEEQYSHYFDFHLINDNFDLTFKRLLDAMENLANEDQWVPVAWVY